MPEAFKYLTEGHGGDGRRCVRSRDGGSRDARRASQDQRRVDPGMLAGGSARGVSIKRGDGGTRDDRSAAGRRGLGKLNKIRTSRPTQDNKEKPGKLQHA